MIVKLLDAFTSRVDRDRSFGFGPFFSDIVDWLRVNLHIGVSIDWIAFVGRIATNGRLKNLCLLSGVLFDFLRFFWRAYEGSDGNDTIHGREDSAAEVLTTTRFRPELFVAKRLNHSGLTN